MCLCFRLSLVESQNNKEAEQDTGHLVLPCDVRDAKDIARFCCDSTTFVCLYRVCNVELG